MALASLEDINLFLPEDKIEVDEARYAPMQLDAERIVRGNFAGFYSPTILASWTDPDNTPGLIRAIAGRLVAQFYYRLRYSEESLENPEYAQNLYDTAMDYVQQILDGKLLLEEIDLTIQDTGHLTSEDFWPNASTGGPVFTMTQEL